MLVHVYLYFLVSIGVAASLTTLYEHTAYRVKDSHTAPAVWTRLGRAPKHHVIPVHIALAQDRFDELEAHLTEISDPDHPRYGQHMSVEDVAELSAPSNEAIEEVLEWLSSSGIEAHQLHFSPSYDLITVALTVQRLQSLLNTTYHVYRHDGHDTKIIRTQTWSLPAHLHRHIDTIQPTNHFMSSQVQRSPGVSRRSLSQRLTARHASQRRSEAALKPSTYPNVAKACHNLTYISPDCILTLYGANDYKPKAGGKRGIAVTSFWGYPQVRSDIRLFLEKFRPMAAKVTFKTTVIANGNKTADSWAAFSDDYGPGLEGIFDATIVTSLTYPLTFSSYSTGGRPPYIPDDFSESFGEGNQNEPYLALLTYLAARPDSELPYVLANSYADDEQTVPYSYAKRVCNLYAQLAARGVTSFTSSGDFGTAPSCKSNDGRNRTQFAPAFPASCSYVTTVGGTLFNKQETNEDGVYHSDSLPEVVATAEYWSTGSGFSNYFARPAWQQREVEGYLDTIGGLHRGYYNRSGRAYPDLAALSDDIATAYNGSITTGEGTSASTPLVASIFALLNDARLAEGLPPLGFLNPLLYKLNGKGFHDVVKGVNWGCCAADNCDGFPAKKGWDAVTGFGSPDFKVLRELIACT